MTSQQDTELRDILHTLLGEWGAEPAFERDQVDKATQALTSWKDKEVITARIDEVKRWLPISPNPHSTWDAKVIRAVQERIKSLQSQGGKNE